MGPRRWIRGGSEPLPREDKGGAVRSRLTLGGLSGASEGIEVLDPSPWWTLMSKGGSLGPRCLGTVTDPNSAAILLAVQGDTYIRAASVPSSAATWAAARDDPPEIDCQQILVTLFEPKLSFTSGPPYPQQRSRLWAPDPFGLTLGQRLPSHLTLTQPTD